MIEWQLSKELLSSGGVLWYDVQGNGPPLVLVHGTPWSSSNWRHLIPALAQWWTIYFYDLLGYGQFTTLHLTIFGKKSSRKVAKAQRKEKNKLKNLAFFAALREKLG